MTPTWLSKLTIEQLPNSDHRQLEPDSAPPYQPHRCWLPGEHTGGPKERPHPEAPRPPLQLRSKQRLKPPARLRVAKKTIYKITNTYQALINSPALKIQMYKYTIPMPERSE
jgi:hypothetical protein